MAIDLTQYLQHVLEEIQDRKNDKSNPGSAQNNTNE
jgi:hypothetical protein